MDVAVIDWKDSKFEKDALYEHINAPQWIDFSDKDPPVDDDAWFCRPDCNHPKTVEDFFKQRTPNSSKLQRSATVSATSPFGDRNLRDAALKKRGFPPNKDSSSSSKHVHDSENHNPNLSTPPPANKAKSIKEMIKSSAEKSNTLDSVLLTKEETPRLLKTTLSARNLFAGRDILNQVTEFCNELKRLTTRTKDNGEKDITKKNTKIQEAGFLQESKSERMPLLEVKKNKYEEIEKNSNAKEKLASTKLNCDPEKTPIALNMKNIRGTDEERVLQIRTNPPSPQCFSANQGTSNATPLKASSRLRQFQERDEIISGKEVKKEVKKSQTASPLSTPNEPKGLDVFWLFKPCTLSS